MKYTLNELLSLPDENIKRRKDRKVKIEQIDGSTIIDYIIGFKVGTNTPNLICEFILMSKNISFHNIACIIIL